MYDAETGLHYLNSRYYDPMNRRMLTPDDLSVLNASPTSLNDKNLYAYCDNNPVSREDTKGQLWNFVVGALVGGVVGGLSAAFSSYESTGKIDARTVVLGASAGAIGGLIGASGLHAGVQAVASGLISAVNNIGNSYIKGEKVNWGDVAVDAAIGAGSSWLGSALTKKASDVAERTLKRGIRRVISGKARYDNGSRYYKGALKRGVQLIRSGSRALNIARGKASVIGSVSGASVSTVKCLLV